jgi:polyhydroxyalkanoate synthesis regulator phasin
MVVEAVQTYLNLVNGLTRATRQRARSTARGLLAQVGLEEVADDAERRVGRLTEEILSASRANRDLLENLVAGEVTKAASRWGFVRNDDLDEVREEIAELRAQLARPQASSPGRRWKPAAATQRKGDPMVPDPDADAGA